MGCDIHGPTIFAKFPGFPESQARRVCELSTGRDYRLFGILAGVRDETVEPIALPRGLPEDAESYLGYYWNDWNGISAGGQVEACEAPHEHIYYPEDCHSLSWLTTDEVVKAQERYTKENSPNTMLTMAILMMRTLEATGWTDARMIFCFDN